MLAFPKFDREFTLYTDASDVGLGVVLSQRDDDGLERVVAYGSRSLTSRERNYATTEKEALAIYYGTQHFRLYHLGHKFTIVTDHSLNTIDSEERLARWLMDFQEFEFSIQHRADTSHCKADALSRLVNKTFDGTSETSDTYVVSTVFSDLKAKTKRFTTEPFNYGLALFFSVLDYLPLGCQFRVSTRQNCSNFAT